MAARQQTVQYVRSMNCTVQFAHTHRTLFDANFSLQTPLNYYALNIVHCANSTRKPTPMDNLLFAWSDFVRISRHDMGVVMTGGQCLVMFRSHTDSLTSSGSQKLTQQTGKIFVT